MNGNCLPLAIVGMALRLPGGAKGSVEIYDTPAYRSSPLWLVPFATQRFAYIFLLAL